MTYIKIDKEKLEKEKERLQGEINKDTRRNSLVKLGLEQWINCIDWVLSIGEEE